jgi:hypothetical protein
MALYFLRSVQRKLPHLQRANIVKLHQMAPEEATNFFRLSLFHKELIEEETKAARILQKVWPGDTDLRMIVSSGFHAGRTDQPSLHAPQRSLSLIILHH